MSLQEPKTTAGTKSRQLCNKCGLPVSAGYSGSITSWILQQNSCKCGERIEDKHNCPICGLPISRGSGASVTSWIFKDNRCQCSPSARNHASTSSVDTSIKLKELVNGVNSSIAGPRDEEFEDIQSHPDAAKFREATPGEIISEKYRIIEVTGRGGMSIVYRAEQIADNSIVALKLMKPQDIPKSAWQRFEKEAQTARGFDHRNLVQVRDFGLVDGVQPYMVMDFIDGPTLADLIAQHGALPVEQVLEIFLQVCDGLAYAYAQRLIHRDLKPSNILLSRNADGGVTVKIVDFGIAKLLQRTGGESLALTRTGEIFGSPPYMSPEQCIGAEVSHRSDLYSLGCTLFEALTGAPPFTAKTAVMTMQKHQSEKPPSLKVGSMGRSFPPELERVVETLLQKDPKARYRNVYLLKEDLVAIVNKKPIAASPAAGVIAPPIRRPAIIALASLAACLVVTFVGVSFYIAKSHEEENRRKNEKYEFEKRFLSEVGVNHKLPSSTGDRPAISGSTPGPLLALDEDWYAPFSMVTADRRVFKFPTDRSLGTIGIGNSASRPARGKYVAPADAELVLAVSWSVLQHPQMLRKFRPDDLKGIMLVKGPINDDTLLFLDHMTGLEFIRIARPQTQEIGSFGNVTDKGLAFISQLPNVRFFEILGTDVTASGLKRARWLHQLEHLDMADVRDARALIPELQKSKKLTRLGIRNGRLTDNDVKAIAKMKDLKTLNLGMNRGITDAGIAYLANCRHLKSLSLANCSVTPKAIPHLKKLPQLEQLALTFDEEWQPADRSNLIRALAGARVSHVDHDYSRSGQLEQARQAEKEIQAGRSF
ncbi:MAG TPA: protein kinase [Candidatus Obscuribacterales bacterium]